MKLTEPEWLIMNALWQGHPATAREVAQRLPDDVQWAYTTIKTMLTRLVAKGALTERKNANVSVYEPLLTRRKARIAALRSLTEEAFDGAFGTLMHFLVEEENLSPSERDKLKRLLDEESGKGAKND